MVWELPTPAISMGNGALAFAKMHPRSVKKKNMKLIDNINDLLGDGIKQSVQPGARLNIAGSCFSIYAYAALKRAL